MVLTIANWNWKLIQAGNADTFESAWSGALFLEFWTATMMYFVVDLAWVASTPICVKSPGTIVKVNTNCMMYHRAYDTYTHSQQHHMLVVFYMVAPLIWPEYRWFMGALLTVEINTWFLIARRLAYKRRVNSLAKRCIGGCFYGSWLLIRCGIYPSVLVRFLQLWLIALDETGTLLHWPIVFLPIHTILCLLNLKWTYDLFKPIVSKWISPQQQENGASPSSGL